VTAEEVLSEKHLHDAGIPLHRRRLAKMTYRVYASDAEVPTGKRVAFKKVAAPLLAQAKIAQHPDGTWEVSMVEVNPASKRKGTASQLYAAIEDDLGIRMSPSGVLTEDGYKFWQRRSPASVQWHQWSSVDQFYVSPNWIDTRTDDLKQEITAIQRKAVSTSLDELDLRSARSELKRLIALWQELPVEARAAKDSMLPCARSMGLRMILTALVSTRSARVKVHRHSVTVSILPKTNSSPQVTATPSPSTRSL
jgi:hypothetical protein